MDRERWSQIKQLFEQVVDLDEQQRGALLKERAAGDEELEREVLRLIEHDAQDETFLTGTKAKQQDAELEPGTRVDDYRIERRLGRGGMGEVYLAHDTKLERKVALKLIHRKLSSSPRAAARFEREARAAARIRSQHVVHVYQHGVDQDSGRQYIAMEYLEGEDLAQRLARGAEPSRKRAVRICSQVCKGLERAHGMGVVHRDLKPANIFLLERDDDMVKLLDFGIAKMIGTSRETIREATTTGGVLGSPHYMSPEQARGQQLDGRSDLWSLAVVAYQLVTGARPFESDEPGDLLVRICSDPVVAPSELAPGLTAAVDRFFGRALSRDPSERFQTASVFAAELAATLGSEPTMGAVVPQRKRGLAAAAIVVGAALLALGIARDSGLDERARTFHNVVDAAVSSLPSQHTMTPTRSEADAEPAASGAPSEATAGRRTTAPGDRHSAGSHGSARPAKPQRGEDDVALGY